MISHENIYAESLTKLAVFELKLAQAVLQEDPMAWRSDDGLYIYSATPAAIPNSEPVDLETLPGLPAQRLAQVLLVWELSRLSPLNDSREGRFDRYVIPSGWELMHTSHTLFAAEVDDDEAVDKQAEAITASAGLQETLGLNEPSPEDYKIVADAIIDLRTAAKAVRESEGLTYPPFYDLVQLDDLPSLEYLLSPDEESAFEALEKAFDQPT